MDVDALKGRVAEALVEGIFRRAGYQVSRVGRESYVQRLVKIGGDEFLPDFLLWKPVEAKGSKRRLHRLLVLEVKYRSNLRIALRKDSVAELSKVRDQWPELYYVFVTDRPDEGRSCFQVLDLSKYLDGTQPTTADLYQLRELDIYRKTVEEYESLVKEIFPLLSGRGRRGTPAEKPTK